MLSFLSIHMFHEYNKSIITLTNIYLGLIYSEHLNLPAGMEVKLANNCVSENADHQRACNQRYNGEDLIWQFGEQTAFLRILRMTTQKMTGVSKMSQEMYFLGNKHNICKSPKMGNS